MKLNKKIETEVLKIYDTWMHSYLHGDVEAYDSFLDNDYHFIGSAKNEEFLNRKDTTKFFEDTGDQFAGKTEIRNETKTIEQFGELIFITHIFDGWFLNENDWNFYARFRFTSVLKNTKDGWRFIYQHFSIPDSKTEEGETIGYDKINDENQELREAITRRTFELEAKNRELEIEGTLERIRAQAVAMKTSSDLLDIVVTMRNEFIKLGHEAHYFWHMMWLPDEYEKAMTSGDGTRIGFVMTLPRHIHGDIPFLAKWEKSKNATVVYTMSVDEAIDYVDKMVDLGDFQNIDPQAPSHDDIRHIGGLTFIMARTTHGEIGYSLPGIVKNPPKDDLDILVRFAGAFDLAHQRFLDLQKAEQQAREVEIELALERVRSRTMAMQHSDELQEASFLLDEQVRGLGIKTWGCAFNIYGEKESTEWFGNEAGVLPTYTVPRKGIFKDYYQKGQKGESLFIKEFSGKACVNHYEYMSALPVIGDVLKNLKKTNKGFPTYQIDHVVYFKYGYLLFITREHVPEAHDIFKRFANVFEQTYTRFLDLQKAEAQAKEAQIETALERVRSRTMAMHKSEELADVAQVLFQQINLITESLDRFNIIMPVKDGDSVEAWVTDQKGHKVSTQFILSSKKSPVVREFNKAWKEKKPILNLHLKGKRLQNWLTYINEVIGIPLKNEKKLKNRHITLVYFTHGYIGTTTHSAINEETIQLIQRFTKVFEQTYTRFLDLQKAEAQAKESQIEAALERVRGKAMAMHNSHDLSDTASMVFTELRKLGVNSIRSGVGVFSKESRKVQLYSAIPLATGDSLSLVGWVQLEKHPVLEKIYESWLKKEDYFPEMQGKALRSYYQSLLAGLSVTMPKFKNDEKQFGHFITSSIGCLYAWAEEGFNEDQLNIFKRFASIIDLTFRRFLELQKAEKRAREAQIEMALERVRSRSMAMQESDELADLLSVLFEQFDFLKIKPVFTFLSLFDLEHNSFSYRMTGKEGQRSIAKQNIDLDINTEWQLAVDNFKKSNPDQVITYVDSKEELPQVFSLFKEILKQIPTKFRPKISDYQNGQFISQAYHRFGYLGLSHFREISEEEKSILIKFSNEFDRSFQRFLELQKAEAQAKEAQIEVALERVRSRSLAMHNSEELQEVITTVLQQLNGLNLPIDSALVSLPLEEEKAFITWIATIDFEYSKGFKIPFGCNSLILDELEKAVSNGNTVYTKQYSSEEKEIFYNELFERSDFRSLPQERKDFLLSGGVFGLSGAVCENSGIITLSYSGKTFNQEEINVLQRFSLVFEQAYTRFLDLQKAEAQAREAQIEAALERVRAKSMAMHHTSELQDVINTVHSEFIKLNIAITGGAFISINNEINQEINCWGAGGTSNYVQRVHIPFLDRPIYTGLIAGIKKGPGLFSETYSNKEKIEFFEHLFKHPPYSESTTKKKKEVMTRTGGYSRSCIVSKNTSIFIINHHGKSFSNSENEILKRFGIVFEQTYTRFLDLQKAEAQAREAQIEAALERVRAQSMAMHSSEELKDVIRAIFDQMGQININAEHAGIVVDYEPKKDWHFWVAETQDIPAKITIPYLDSIWDRQFTEAKQNNKTLFTTLLDFDEKNAFYKKLLPHIEGLTKEMKASYFKRDGLAISTALQKDIGLYIENFSGTPYTDEENSILLRFAKVFQQTYTRFLDLQKAEAQAREAQIELGLERVRARAMAMQNTNELSDLVANLLHELTKLDFSLTFCIINIINEADNSNMVWATNPEEGKAPESYYMRFEEYPFHHAMMREWKAQTPKFIYVMEGKEKEIYDDYLYTDTEFSRFPKEVQTANRALDKYVSSFVFSKFGGLQTVGNQPLSDESLDILYRFGKVFDLTYTRFNDLKKAEAQAREAQIVASLERIRAATMAMHQSNELSNVLSTLFEQYDILGINPSHAVLTLINKEKNTLTFRTTGKNGYQVYAEQEVDLNLYDSWIDTTEKWKKSNPNAVNVNEYPPEVLPEVWEVYKDVVNAIPKKARPEIKDFPEGLFITEGYCQFGYIGFAHSRKPTEEEKEIVRRFAAEFGSLYQRFLDLQKAEAQAREAQIEVALEKIRSRTMAMQKGEELKDVVVLLYKELIALGVTNFTTCGYVEVNEETERQLTYVTDQGGDSLGLFYLPMQGDEVFDERYAAWKNQQAVFHQTVGGKKRREHLEYAITTFNSKEAEEMVLTQFPDPTVFYCFNFSHGYLHIVGGSRLTADEETLMARFTRVFEQTYARFLDLKKAEHQTREAQINLAVERVRAKALAMHKSEDIIGVVAKLKDEVMSLDIPDVVAATIFLKEGEEKVRMWDLSSLEQEDNYSEVPFDLTFKIKKRDPHFYVKRVWENPEDYFVVIQDEKGFKRLMKWLRELDKNEIAKEVEEYIEKTQLKRLYHTVKKLHNGKLAIDLLNPPSDEMEPILTKMGAAFDLAYKRFEDLKKAEAQTKESQIQLALERVRAKTMAMQHSDELREVVLEMYEQLQQLDFDSQACNIIIIDQNTHDQQYWVSGFSQELYPESYQVPNLKHPYIQQQIKAWKKGIAYAVFEYKGAEKRKFDKLFFSETDFKKSPKEAQEMMRSLESVMLSTAFTTYGSLQVLGPVSLNEEKAEVLQRFAQVFDQTYTRFLDLKKAEAQTKESQIEAALEKVRSRSLAMQKPDELHEVVAIIAEKLKEVGVIFDAGGVILCTYFPDNKDVVHWIAVPDFSSSGRYYVPYFDNPIFNDAWDSKIRGDAYFSKEFPVEVKNHFFEHTFKNSDYKDFPEDYKQHVLQAEKHTLSAAWSKNSAILIPSLTGLVPSESDAQIMQRFAKVFEQAYIRFMELQQAEIREKEAVKQASLDRVRGEIASMRTTKDLERITPLIWKELTTLGVPFFRCGVFIIREDEKMVHAYLSKPDGTSVAALHIPFSDTDNKLIKPTIKNWRLQKVYKETWNQDQFIQQTHMFMEKGQIENPDAYDISETPPEQLVLHLIPFKQGMVYVGNSENLTTDQITLVESLSGAFSVAYSRYEDFKALETAKNSLELTINDLKSTQAQLIQAEKMASLGELTAGIAHEIQNPLNFVNNFSEVSEELVDEMNEELENGDLEEAKMISKDLKDNLSKINHHGKRADAIVKGMLEHSRINKGEKKPTDINALLDEFVRLSYHGLRAKDKSFNADFKLNLDPNLPIVNVVSSDIGRVILNLVNNAFYACTERSRSAADKQGKSEIKTYNPEVIISSKQTEHGIQISVKDNGGGIPEQVRDKIFQPFFTTKPTGKGTGLGLSLSYDIIKAHGGKLTLESSEGEGTLFSIQIPIQ